MDSRFPLTPVRILPPEGPGRTQTPRQSVLNISPSPYRRKRNYSQIQPPASPKPIPAPSPQPTKAIIREEVGRLQAAIEAGRLITASLAFDDDHIELEDSAHHSQAEDPYLQTSGEFIQTRQIPIPQGLFERYRQAVHTSPGIKLACGLLCDIHRVWFGLERLLFLWDYESGALVEAAELSDQVVSATIVPRNSDIFTNKVLHMVLVTTPTSIHLFGVDPLCRLLPTDISVPSNEEHFHQFVHFPSGRIFMGGAEGSISELRYGNSSWFSSAKRYKREDCGARSVASLLPRFLRFFATVRVAHMTTDPSRHLLYVLIAKANRSSEYRIDIYDLGPAGDQMRRKASIQAHTLTKRIKEHNSRLANVPVERLSVVTIAAITRALSVEYHLMALTKNGIRIYLSLHLAPVSTASTDDILHMRPTGDFSLTLKFPPVAVKSPESAPLAIRSQAVSTTADKPSNYEQAAVMEEGSMVLIDRREGECKLVTIRRSLRRIALVQEHPSQSILEPEENVCCVEELRDVEIQALGDVPIRAKVHKDLAELCGVLPRGEFMLPPITRWLGTSSLSQVCQTSLSNFIYIPSARFQLLTSESLLEFSEVRPIDTLCEILEKEDGKEAERLRELGEKYGLTHLCSWLIAIATSSSSQGKPHPRDAWIYQLVSDKIRHKGKLAFARLSSTPQASPSPSYRLPSNQSTSVALDQSAISLHLSRILRPIWLEKVSYCEEDAAVQVEHLAARHYDIVAVPLRALLTYIEDNYRDRLDTKPDLSQDGIVQLVTLIRRCLQAISLLSILSAHYNFRRVVNELPASEQQLLSSLTVQDLVATRLGQDLAKSMIEAYVRQVSEMRIGKGARVKLEDLLKEFTTAVPSYFTEADAEIYIAEETLVRARSEMEVERRRDLISLAMGKLSRNAASVCLNRTLSELLSLGEVLSAVNLCLNKANSLAVIGSDLSTSETNECYEAIFTILTEIQHCLQANSPDQVDYLSGLSLESLLILRQDLLLECCRVNDKQLHWALFNWLVRWELSKLILQMESPYVMMFLEQKFPQEKYPAVSLIADYSMKMRDYRKAYLEYGRLAALTQERDPVHEVIQLDRRTELLDLSLLCLDSLLAEQHPGSEALPTLIKAREGLLFNQRLCKIQQRLQRDLASAGLLPEAEALDRRLYSAEEMYEHFAKPFDRYEVELELLNFISANSATQTAAIIETMKSLFLPILATCGLALWPQRVREKLEELGRKYPQAFPLDSICVKCEQTNLQLGVESPWVVQLVTSLPLVQDFGDLFHIYRDLWTTYHGDLEAEWCLLIKLECLFRLWLEAAERCIGSSGSVWSSGTGLKIARDRLISLLPSVLETMDSVLQCVLNLPLDRQRRVEPSFLDLRDRFLKLEALLQVKASSRRHDPALPDSALSAQSHKFSLLAPKALSFKETPQRSSQASPRPD